MAKVKANSVAVYVFRKRAGGIEFLQLKRADRAESYPASWQTVYGGILKRETAVEAALRELDEETGLKPRNFYQVEHLESFYNQQRDRVVLMPVFAAEVAGNASVQLNEEHDDYRWVVLADVANHFVWRAQRQVIEIIQSDIIAGLPSASLLQILKRDDSAAPSKSGINRRR
ncbi:MAG: NUDIX domain-containing protein [Phycisphaerales bacterium]|nr:NUDIX domain-containing protein [Phycisphaerales bacterium]